MFGEISLWVIGPADQKQICFYANRGKSRDSFPGIESEVIDVALKKEDLNFKKHTDPSKLRHSPIAHVMRALSYTTRGCRRIKHSPAAGRNDHFNLAAVGPPIIPVSRPSFCRVPPGMRSIHPHKWHNETAQQNAAKHSKYSPATWPNRLLGEISMSFYMIHILVFFSVYTVVAPGELMSQDVTSAARDAARSELACAVPARSTLPLPDLNDTSRGLQRFDMDVQARPQEWAEANVLFLFYKYVSPLLCIHFMRAGIEWHR